MLAVVTDSSPIIYLTRLGLLSVLRKLHETVIVPHAVWQEVVVGGKGLPESSQLQDAASEGWIQVKAPSESKSSLGISVAALGRGEIEAVLLAREFQAILLTDDAGGRDLAERLGIKVTGTVGVLIRAKSEGHVTDLRAMLDQLRNETNFRMSAKLYLEALKEGGELPSRRRNDS